MTTSLQVTRHLRIYGANNKVETINTNKGFAQGGILDDSLSILSLISDEKFPYASITSFSCEIISGANTDIPTYPSANVPPKNQHSQLYQALDVSSESEKNVEGCVIFLTLSSSRRDDIRKNIIKLHTVMIIMTGIF